MHLIEPFYNWRNQYIASNDYQSPFYGKKYNELYFENTIYNYLIHPQWDYIGSETLYIKIIFANYAYHFAIIECFGEWNDAINNDIMHLKRNVIDVLLQNGIQYFAIIGENIFNFHGSDDCYYEEWFDDIEDGWIFGIGFQDHIISEWKKFGINAYIDYDIDNEFNDWRTNNNPLLLLKKLQKVFNRRLN